MAESEDWRVRRAAELGLEFYHQVERPLHTLGNRADRLPRSAGADPSFQSSGEDADSMHSKPADIKPTTGDRKAEAQGPSRSADTSNRAGLTGNAPTVGPRHVPRSSTRVHSLRGRNDSRALPIALITGLATLSAFGIWFLKDHTRLVDYPLLPLRVSSMGPAKTIRPLPVTLATAMSDRRMKTSPLPPLLVSCDASEVAGQLRAAVTSHLRKPNLTNRHTKAGTIVWLSRGHVKAADPAGALTICTAGLVWRSAGETSLVDIDYAVETQANGVARVVPISFNYAVKGLEANVRGVQKPDTATVPAPGGVARATISRARAPSGVAAGRSRDVVIVSRALPAVITGSLPGLATPSIGLPQISDPRALVGDAVDTLPRFAKKPRGCENPATLSVSITCTSRTLLALNAQVTGLVSTITDPRSERKLVMAKRRADQQFDRCATASCVAKAYSYWFEELAKIKADSAEPGSLEN